MVSRILAYDCQAVDASEKQGVFCFQCGTVTEFNDIHAVYPVIALDFMVIGMEAFQSSVGGYPDVSAIVFQHSMYGTVLKAIFFVETPFLAAALFYETVAGA